VTKRSVVLVLVFAVTAACGGGGGGGSSAKAFCDELNRQRLSTSSATEADVTAALDKLVALAPSEIKKDMEAIRTFNNLVMSGQSADSSRSAELEASVSSASSATNGNFDKITAFVKDKCQIDLGTNATTSSFSTTGSSIN
jgi:hypothetical protein